MTLDAALLRWPTAPDLVLNADVTRDHWVRPHQFVRRLQCKSRTSRGPRFSYLCINGNDRPELSINGNMAVKGIQHNESDPDG